MTPPIRVNVGGDGPIQPDDVAEALRLITRALAQGGILGVKVGRELGDLIGDALVNSRRPEK